MIQYLADAPFHSMKPINTFHYSRIWAEHWNVKSPNHCFWFCSNNRCPLGHGQTHWLYSMAAIFWFNKIGYKWFLINTWQLVSWFKLSFQRIRVSIALALWCWAKTVGVLAEHKHENWVTLNNILVIVMRDKNSLNGTLEIELWFLWVVITPNKAEMQQQWGTVAVNKYQHLRDINWK